MNVVAGQGTKMCKDCEATYPATTEYFSRVKRWLNSYCKKCQALRAKARSINKAQAIKKQQDQWVANNRDRANEKSKRWKTNNQDKVKAWRIANRVKGVIAAQKRRAIQKSLPSQAIDHDLALHYFNNNCAYCDKKLVNYHMDHFIPLSDPSCPGTVQSNMIPACATCNRSKHANDPIKWVTKKFGEKQATQILQRIYTYFSTFNSI